MPRRMFKYRLYPSKTQTKVLEEQLELCRLAHNRLLDYCKQQYKEKGKTPSHFDLNNHLITLKQLREEFSRIHSQVLQIITKRIKDSYTNFYARRKIGLKDGFPGFKKYGRYKSITHAYVEDLRITNMVGNHCLAKSISDAGWGRFIGMIAYKAESAGGQLIQVNPRNTTQNCFRCRLQVKKTLSERIHVCPHCGLVMSRDHNAALNILARGQGIGQELPKYRPVEEKASTQPQLVEQAYPVKQEAALLAGR